MTTKHCSEDLCGTLEYTRIENEMIIGFNLWGEKRLCLPHLLRFVLNDFDIDVIDRAVTDLQINCFQCTEEQMQMLHNINIFPQNIVRCGLIRKSDAERLCKYVLQPNQLLDSLAQLNERILRYPSILVVHMCFGQQDGVLFPALYTNVHSKCIKCTTCENLFCTYEFVGHTHKLDEVSSTSHWGFDSNNWRLLIHLNLKENMSSETLKKSKTILDNIKLLFYEEELNKLGKFNKGIIWRPQKQIKLPKPLPVVNRSALPSHLNKNTPPDVFQKTPSKVPQNRNWMKLIHTNHAPNIYLKLPDWKTNSNCENSNSESIFDDDDDDVIEEEDEFNNQNLQKRNQNALSKLNVHPDDVALNTALQIKNEIAPKDLISLGAVSQFFSQKELTPHQQIPQQNQQVVIAPSSTSVPTQYLMLEAVWSQLLRDIIQMTSQLVDYNKSQTALDDKNRIITQLFRCQDIFRTQWTNLAEENVKLKDTLLNEQDQRKSLISTLNDMKIEKERLTTVLRQIEIEKNEEISMLRKKTEVNAPVKRQKRSYDEYNTPNHCIISKHKELNNRSFIDMNYTGIIGLNNISSSNIKTPSNTTANSHMDKRFRTFIDCKSPTSSPISTDSNATTIGYQENDAKKWV